MLLRTYLSNVTPQQGPVQYIPVVSVIVAQERPAAARNDRGKENLKSRSFSCASTEGNGLQMQKAEVIAAEAGVHNSKQVVEKITVFVF